MQSYWLIDRTNGEAILVDGDTLERLLGVELGYVEWCIKVDGIYENGRWRLLGLKAHEGREAVFCCGCEDLSQFPQSGHSYIVGAWQVSQGPLCGHYRLSCEVAQLVLAALCGRPGKFS